jgi:uncharacterized membrane protein YgdD (TMEM256/DUF423 family)
VKGLILPAIAAVLKIIEMKRRKYLPIVVAAGCFAFLVGVALFVYGGGEPGTVYETLEAIGLGCIVFGGIVMLVGWLLTVFKKVSRKSGEDKVKYGRRDK